MILMGENVIIMVVSAMCPITIMITALVIWKFPAEYKGIWAYHTAYAEKSPEAWAAAQHYFGKIGFFSNLAALILTIIAFVPVLVVERFQSYGTVVCMIVTIVQMAVLFVDIFVVEGMLKKHFDKDGKLKQ